VDEALLLRLLRGAAPEEDEALPKMSSMTQSPITKEIRSTVAVFLVI